jgi:hypothetical protein
MTFASGIGRVSVVTSPQQSSTFEGVLRAGVAERLKVKSHHPEGDELYIHSVQVHGEEIAAK